jgi:16S rRNA (guanine527-N7)-methyltransferase
MEKFRAYYDFLEERNRVMDLTAVSGEEETALRHFGDSLTPLLCADLRGARLLDVGSGAGFPGLPLCIAEPSIRLTLLDSQGKRVRFLEELCPRLGVEAECLQARAEEQALLPGYREAYDAVVSRAVAKLSLLGELCVPFLKVGGLFLAMKAEDSDAELEEARPGLGTLGAKVEEIREFRVGDVPRRIVCIRKVRPTPKGFPRKYARMVKKPL